MLKLKLQSFGHLMRRADIWKDPDAGKDGRWEEKGTTEDEMVGWHHQLNGHEFEQTPGVGDGQGSLACYSPWGRKESDTTEWLNWSDLNWRPCSGLGFGLRECCVWFDLPSRPFKFSHISNTFGLLSCHSSVHWNSTFHFLQELFLCVHRLPVWHRRPSVWPVLTFDKPSSLPNSRTRRFRISKSPLLLLPIWWVFGILLKFSLSNFSSLWKYINLILNY